MADNDWNNREIRPHYTVSPDDDLYGSPRSWTGPTLRVEDPAGAAATDPPEWKRPLPRRRVNALLGQTVAAVVLIAAAFAVLRGRIPELHNVAADVRVALAENLPADSLPASVARALGAGRAAPAVASPSAVPAEIALVAPVHGQIVRSFSVVSPDVVIAGRPGEPVLALAQGLVDDVGATAAQGDYVMIDHGAFGVTFYAHLGRVVVHDHEYVDAGQVLGYLPDHSGNLTFGFIRAGSYRNPATVLRYAK
ncbi:MAG: M23 family metallopeptidase [Firmicutes bacterium]|nr:M23 family metallopeptidase [Bacillota bacterium]